MNQVPPSDIRSELRRYVEENFMLGASDRALRDGDSFLEHHVLDSTGFLELVAHVEEHYGVKVGDDEMTPENLDSIAAVSAFIQRKRG